MLRIGLAALAWITITTAVLRLVADASVLAGFWFYLLVIVPSYAVVLRSVLHARRGTEKKSGATWFLERVLLTADSIVLVLWPLLLLTTFISV